MIWPDLLIGFLVLVTSVQPSRLHDGCSRVLSHACCALVLLYIVAPCVARALASIALHAWASSARCRFAASAQHPMSSWVAVACTHRHRAYIRMCRVSCIRLERIAPHARHSCASSLVCSIACSCIHIVLPRTQYVPSRCTSCIGLRVFGR